MSFPFQSSGISWASLNRASAEVGGWKELARTTNGSELDDIDTSSLANKRYYMVLADIRKGTGDHGSSYIINNDTGTVYSARRNTGGSDNTNVNLSTSGAYLTDTRSAINFNVSYICNLAGNEKMWINYNVNRNTAGAGTTTIREEGHGKWANTSNAIDRIATHNWHSGNYGTNSEQVVLGWDPADTHTDNFWEELASVDATGSSTNLSTGTITAKQYLWIQGYDVVSSGGNSNITFNNDTGTAYNRRYSINGANDSTTANQTSLVNFIQPSGTTPNFFNIFILNEASDEKLVYCLCIQRGSAGAGNTVIRSEFTGKWTNTADQITEIDFDSTSGNYPSSGTIRVWGAD